MGEENNMEKENIAEAKKMAIKHLPVLYFDKNEPFFPVMVGYTVFDKEGDSFSAPKKIELNRENRNKCIEYAFYYDYDIQHLYDLEHLWIYLDREEKVCGCEFSFHGMYLNAEIPGIDLLKGTSRVHMYVQPGKHAFMPAPELFALHTDFMEVCNKKAGAGGILCPDMLKEKFFFTKEEDLEVKEYIKKTYSFSPAQKYEEEKLSVELLMPWPELLRRIPERMGEEKKKWFDN